MRSNLKQEILKSLKKRFRDQGCMENGVFILLKLILIIFSIFCCAEVFAADDLLAGSSSNVMKTFGKDSSFIKYVYVGETLMSCIGYAKTKNIAMLAGLPVLMIFTNLAFGIIEGA